MQKLVFFIEPTDKNFGSASTAGNLFMNRFAIDEDAGHEIVNTYKIEKHLRRYQTIGEKEQ